MLQFNTTTNFNNTCFIKNHHVNFRYNNKRFIGGAGLQNDLQGFAAFVAYQESHKRGLSASRATLEKSIGQQPYFGVMGKDDSIGLLEQPAGKRHRSVWWPLQS
jgi:hypothetical protein